MTINKKDKRRDEDTAKITLQDRKRYLKACLKSLRPKQFYLKPFMVRVLNARVHTLTVSTKRQLLVHQKPGRPIFLAFEHLRAGADTGAAGEPRIVHSFHCLKQGLDCVGAYRAKSIAPVTQDR